VQRPATLASRRRDRGRRPLQGPGIDGDHRLQRFLVERDPHERLLTSSRDVTRPCSRAVRIRDRPSTTEKRRRRRPAPDRRPAGRPAPGQRASSTRRQSVRHSNRFVSCGYSRARGGFTGAGGHSTRAVTPGKVQAVCFIRRHSVIGADVEGGRRARRFPPTARSLFDGLRSRR